VVKRGTKQFSLAMPTQYYSITWRDKSGMNLHWSSCRSLFMYLNARYLGSMAHLAWKKGVYQARVAFDITFQYKTTISLNTLTAGLWIYGTWKSAKTSSFWLLTNAIAHPPIVLKSCSNPQKIRQVFWSALDKKFLIGVADFLWVVL